LRRTDAIWKALGKAALVERSGAPTDPHWLLLTTEAVPAASAAGKALRQARKLGLVHDALDIFQDATASRLRTYAAGEVTTVHPLFPKDRS